MPFDGFSFLSISLNLFFSFVAPSAFTKEDTDGLIVDTPSLWGIYNKSDKIDACKEFLKALAESEEGQKALVENCGMVSPFK